MIFLPYSNLLDQPIYRTHGYEASTNKYLLREFVILDTFVPEWISILD